MITKRRIDHPDRDLSYSTGAYSDGLISGRYLFVSGQASVDFKNSKFVLGSIAEETERTLQNIKAIVEAGGASMDAIVKCTVHLANISDFADFNNVYSQYFTGVLPARTTVQSTLAEGIRVEIDCIAELP